MQNTVIVVYIMWNFFDMSAWFSWYSNRLIFSVEYKGNANILLNIGFYPTQFKCKIHSP